MVRKKATERRSSVAWTGGCRRGPQVGEQQGTKRELAVLLLGLEVDGGRRSTMSSMRNTTTEDCSHPEASLTGGSGCRWLLHEGEWVTLRVGSMEDDVDGWWCSLANRGSSSERRAE
jgi:hypothetical protein